MRVFSMATNRGKDVVILWGLDVVGIQYFMMAAIHDRWGGWHLSCSVSTNLLSRESLKILERQLKHLVIAGKESTR